jgi:septal ring factor EnvC (AmiA/AmiB activator)
MRELISPNTPSNTDSSSLTREDLSAAIKRIATKVQLIADAVNGLCHDRAQLEGKIEDAQQRIQHILSRLPEQSDGRQLNLLGQVVAPPIPEDDNEPTTH